MRLHQVQVYAKHLLFASMLYVYIFLTSDDQSLEYHTLQRISFLSKLLALKIMYLF